jgi:insulin-like growth factor 1 receptor
MRALKGCTVIEGNLVLSLGILNFNRDQMKVVPELNMTFPELREITDYLMIYEAHFVSRLTNIFPNLSVIRGNKLLMVSGNLKF